MGDGLFQSVQGELEHGKDVPDDADGARIMPLVGGDRIEPDGMGEGLGYEPQPLDTRLAGVLAEVDGAVMRHELGGRHAGIADDDKPRFRIEPHELFDGKGLVMPAGVLPEHFVDGVVKVEVFDVLELRAGVMEERLHDVDVGIHGPAAVVDGEDDL